MYRALPLGLCSFDYRVLDEDDAEVGRILLPRWRGDGSVRCDGTAYIVRRQGFLRPAWTFEDANGTWLRAKPAGIWSLSNYEVRVREGPSFLVRRDSWLGRTMRLEAQGRRIGAMRSAHHFTRRARIEWSDAHPMQLMLFFVWLTALSWRRLSNNAGAGACL